MGAAVEMRSKTGTVVVTQRKLYEFLAEQLKLSSSSDAQRIGSGAVQLRTTKTTTAALSSFFRETGFPETTYEKHRHGGVAYATDSKNC